MFWRCAGVALCQRSPQLLPPLLRQQLELAEIFPIRLLLRGGQRTELFPAFAQQLAALLRQLLPLIEALARLGALLRRHAQPTLAAAGEGLLALRGQLVPLARKPRQQPLLVR